jgi:CcmD family protein
MVYLAAAFIGIWVLVTGYVIFVSQRQRQLTQELETLEEMLAERGVTKQ